jgi:hypothetical protein
VEVVVAKDRAPVGHWLHIGGDLFVLEQRKIAHLDEDCQLEADELPGHYGSCGN